MKLIDIMREDSDIGWCFPMTDGRGNWVVIRDEHIAYLIDEEGNDPDDITETDLKAMAMTAAGDYYEEESEESTDEEIIMANFMRTGCTECPWRDICENVNEEIEDDDTDE